MNSVFFDWDGTLIDTAQAAFRAFRKSLGDLGIALDRSHYEKIYSPDWYRMYQLLGLPAGKWAEADNLWLRHYGQEIPEMVPGAREAIALLKNEGITLGIVTSGSRLRVRREAGAHGLLQSFEVIVCDEDVVNRKPHPEGLETAMRRAGRQREMCCYVGDTPEDMEMGKRAGVITIGIPGGFPNSHRIADAGADIVLRSIHELPARLNFGNNCAS